MKVGGEERRDQEEGLASVAIKITDYAPAYGMERPAPKRAGLIKFRRKGRQMEEKLLEERLNFQGRLL
jgi:hypothetical protein